MVPRPGVTTRPCIAGQSADARVCLSKEQLIAYGSFLLNLLSAANYSGGAWIEAFQTEFAVSLAEASAVSGANNAGFAVGSFVCFLFPQLVNYPSSAFYCVTAHALKKHEFRSCRHCPGSRRTRRILDGP